ncbi:MAG: DUF2809 domain-containing protein [Myxococcales bacterium]
MPTPPPRQRGTLAIWLVVLVALGFVSRRPGVPEFCVLYVGDVLWGALFFGLAAFARPAAAPLRLWVVAAMTTELIELSQLYQAPWAQAVRATRLGGLLLGHSFSWSDTVCVVLGASAAALVDALCRSGKC